MTLEGLNVRECLVALVTGVGLRRIICMPGGHFPFSVLIQTHVNRCKPQCYLCSRSMAHLIDAKARKARLIADAACMSNDQAAARQHRTASHLVDIFRNADRYCGCASLNHSLTSPSAEGRGLGCR